MLSSIHMSCLCVSLNMREDEKHSSEFRSSGSFQTLQMLIAFLANPHGRPNFLSLHIKSYLLFVSSDLHKCLFRPGPACRNSALRRDSAAHLHSKISYNHNLWTLCQAPRDSVQHPKIPNTSTWTLGGIPLEIPNFSTLQVWVDW